MRVLHLLTSTKFSGAESVACQIIKMFNNEIEMIYCSPKGDIENTLKEKEIEFLPLNKFSIVEIKKAINIYQPDVIHAHDFTASIISSICTNKPIISHIHQNPLWAKKINIKTLIYTISSIRYFKIVGVSSSIFDEFILSKLFKKKQLILTNFIDIEYILSQAEDNEKIPEMDVIFVGRLVDAKNPKEFIEVINSLVNKFPDLMAGMVGYGNLYEECKFLVELYQIKKNVKMYKFKTNPYKYINKSKITVITSKYEGLGLAALESLILGKPVISTNVGGLREYINNKNGRLCNNREEMICEIEKILTDSDYLKIKELNTKEIYNKVISRELYKSMLKKLYDRNEK